MFQLKLFYEVQIYYCTDCENHNVFLNNYHVVSEY